MRAFLLAFLLFTFSYSVTAQVPQTPKRPLFPSDIYRLQTPSSLEISPDGNWILYTVRKVDSAKDKFSSSLWMISWDGKENVQLTFDKSASSAKWSPDGKYISFVGTRDDEKNSQVYLLDRRGGEARKLTSFKGDIDEYNWSPAGDRLVLSIKDEDFSDTANTKIRKPYVIDRYHFKQDRQGYLDSAASHLYVFTLATKKLDTLTRGFYSEEQPVFSPDGKQIAFVSNRSTLPDNNANSDLFVMEARAGASPRKLTSWEGSDEQPVWSPDGKMIAYLQSSSNEPFTMYGQPLVTVIPANGGEKKVLTAEADRPIRNLRWNNDGNQLTGLMEDDREVVIVSIDPATGKVTRLTSGERSFYEMEWNRHKNSAVTVMSTVYVPAELFAFEGRELRQLTHLQDSFLAPLHLPKVEGFRSKSKDGTSISGILYRPASTPAGTKLPLIIFIHGGPVGQDEFDFDLDRMIYASAGYAVAAVNYRGSSGRGLNHIKSIYGDWGNKEVMDIVGAADHLVAQGIADVARMGLGGWSYGGITTNYTIATDQRFKAAVSGAGSSLQLSLYGSDQYVTQYEKELGYPWKNPEKWIAVSYPFFKADRIKTPTLFMASESDFNVPVTGAEQMYQALKALNVPTGLIIYPKQYHGISVPSYLKDRYQRHIAWYNKYLK
ncbi:alpha/beta hydrolase family protein [Flavihumibacter solisilvae]|uniref:Peptidase S9 n=1 Tax=Flavihumibacter solisilvae TaxID=1349421 RepID=A0A0C1L694_9BACT|nr:S9 family peptidase [Flavihumibacter solisilvae]KIC95657.1 peptidase S9 [Flavihumibacter solisilvae]